MHKMLKPSILTWIWKLRWISIVPGYNGTTELAEQMLWNFSSPGGLWFLLGRYEDRKCSIFACYKDLEDG